LTPRPGRHFTHDISRVLALEVTFTLPMASFLALFALASQKRHLGPAPVREHMLRQEGYAPSMLAPKWLPAP
jgi:hypothetical protein